MPKSNSNSNSNDYIDPRKMGPYNINPNSTNHPKHDQAYINMNSRKKSINQMVRMDPNSRAAMGTLRRSQINPNVPYGMSPSLTPVSRTLTRGARTPKSRLSSVNLNSESNLSSIPWDAESSFEPIDSVASSLSSISMHDSNSNSNSNYNQNWNSGYNSDETMNSFSTFGNRSRNFSPRRMAKNKGKYKEKRGTYNASTNYNRNNDGMFPFLGFRRFEKGTMSKGSKRSKSKTKKTKNKKD
jgi:hypothetical protein